MLSSKQINNLLKTGSIQITGIERIENNQITVSINTDIYIQVPRRFNFRNKR